MFNETNSLGLAYGVETDASLQRYAVHATMLAAAATVTTPSIVVQKNVNGYVSGSSPIITGQADANTIIKIFTADGTQVGTTTVDATKIFSLTLAPFADGSNYQVYATATSPSGAVSAHSDALAFNVDATAPVAPQATLSVSATGNIASFVGIGEAGSAIDIVLPGKTIDTSVVVGHTTVDSNGHWSLTTSPLPNGAYNLSVVSSDLAGNASSAPTSYSFGINNPNNITGTDKNDSLKLGAPNIAINGGDGIDTLTVNGKSTDYTLAKESWGYGLTDKVGNGGHDALINVERVNFTDTSIALDVNGNAGEIFRLYQAVFNRPAEAEGLGYWIMRMDTGTSLLQVTTEFMNQPEFDAMYGLHPTDEEFITKLYFNILHRDPDPSGYKYWIDTLAAHPDARATILKDFSEGFENQALVIGSIQNGMTYTPWHTA